MAHHRDVVVRLRVRQRLQQEARRRSDAAGDLTDQVRDPPRQIDPGRLRQRVGPVQPWGRPRRLPRWRCGRRRWLRALRPCRRRRRGEAVREPLQPVEVGRVLPVGLDKAVALVKAQLPLLLRRRGERRTARGGRRFARRRISRQMHHGGIAAERAVALRRIIVAQRIAGGPPPRKRRQYGRNIAPSRWRL